MTFDSTSISIAIASVAAPGSSAGDVTLAGAVELVQENLNVAWVLIASGMVLLMQAGFMCLESGGTRAKNSINVAVKNLVDLLIAVAGFWLIGFGLMFGGNSSILAGWVGTSGWMPDASDGMNVPLFFVFQAVFCGTAATIVSGAVAERTRFSAYMLLSLLVSVLIYPVSGHWAWGSLLSGNGHAGWLEGMGFRDFAGSSVVHLVGGAVALASVLVVGPRLGRFEKDPKTGRVVSKPIAPHSLVLMYLGTFILFFGWFGFNAGSNLTAEASLAVIVQNTLLAACFGGLAAAGLHWVLNQNEACVVDAVSICNGTLAGLVGITAGCDVLTAGGAAVVGLTSGLLMVVSARWLEKLAVDDVVGAVPVHGFCGLWGTVCVGIFAPAAALPEAGRLAMIGVQLMGGLAIGFWAFTITVVVLRLIQLVTPLRVTREEEMRGLNVAEHGATTSVIDLAAAMHLATTEQNYRVRVPIEHGTEIGDLGRMFNSMTASLHQKAEADGRLRVFNTKLGESVAEISEETRRMEQTLVDTERDAKAMAQQVQSVGTEVNAMLSELRNVSNCAAQRNQDNTGRVASFANSIKGISSQTHLLSLNANVEAARAGESGKGFAVVADEIRNLAGKAREATDQINDGVTGVRNAGEEMATAVRTQADKIEGLNNKMLDVADTTSALVSKLQHVGTGAGEVSARVSNVYEDFRTAHGDKDA